jgi:hypothetical protein
MMTSRRSVLASLAALLAAATPLSRAQTVPNPFVIYDDELKNGWQNWSWGVKLDMSLPAGSSKAMRVQGEPWSALQLHHDPFSTAGFSKLVFYINGGGEGGQTLTIKAGANNKHFEPVYVIQPKAKTWAVVEVPLKDIGAADKTIDAILWQAQGDSYKAYYISRIQLE